MDDNAKLNFNVVLYPIWRHIQDGELAIFIAFLHYSCQIKYLAKNNSYKLKVKTLLKLSFCIRGLYFIT